MTIKTLENYTAAKSIKAQLNALNKTTEVMAVIGQNIAAQLVHGNTNHLTAMVKELANKDGSLNKYAKEIMSYLNAHEGLKVSYSAKNGVKVKGKPSAVNCFASFLEVNEAEKAAKREEAKAKREEAKGTYADIEAQAAKLATMLKSYGLGDAKVIMLLAEELLIADLMAEQEKNDGNMEMPKLTVPFEEAV